jgi:hypothetical protein
MSSAPIPVASYGGLGAWAAAELDATLLEAGGIRSAVAGDAHHPAPLFSGHQVVLLVEPADRERAADLLVEHDGGHEDRMVLPPD